MNGFGNYETLEELSTSPTCREFRGRDRTSQLEVRIQAFPVARLTVASKQRLTQELELAAKISHPNIAGILEFGEEHGFVYAVTELVHGETVQEFFNRRTTWTPETRIRFISEVCEALTVAHEHGCIHRAISASSIAITAAGNPKILDLGVTAANPAEDAPNYKAPEQLRYQRGDARSDVFSAALVFFDVLTGKHAFPRQDVIHEILHEEAPSIRDLNPDLPVRLAVVIAKALSKSPMNRYQTAADFGKAVRAAVTAGIEEPEITPERKPRRLEVAVPKSRAVFERVEPVEKPVEKERSGFISVKSILIAAGAVILILIVFMALNSGDADSSSLEQVTGPQIMTSYEKPEAVTVDSKDAIPSPEAPLPTRVPSQLDPYDELYLKAENEFASAITEADFRNVVKDCEPLLRPGLFKQAHGLELQDKCRLLKDQALKAIEDLQK
jgi:serine/threonine protein kinase